MRTPELRRGAVGQVLALWWVGSQQWSRIFHPEQGWGPASAVQSGSAFVTIRAARVDEDGRALLVDDQGLMQYLPMTGWRRIASLPAAAADVYDKRAMIDSEGTVILLWVKRENLASGPASMRIFTAQFRP